MRFTQNFYDPDKILFFDLNAVYDMNGVVQKWHRPDKYPRVLKPELPWEGDMTLCETVYPSPDGARLYCGYRCYYHSQRFPELVTELGHRVACRAESTDGITWNRSELGRREFRGSTANNMLPDGYHFRTMLDPEERDPAKRYKGIVLLFPKEVASQAIEQSRKGRCFYSATSPDGIHWTEPRMMHGFEETGDTDGLCWDDRNKQYLFTTRKRGYWISDAYPDFYKRPVKKGMPEGRWIALSTSRDFASWSELDNIMVRDPMDELGVDFYNAVIFPYGPIYVGFLRRHHFWHGLMDTELVWSTDLRRWNRSWYRRPFLSWGELGDDDWCFGDIIGCKPVQCGDRLLMAYEGRNHVHAPHANKERGLLGMDAVMGMATLRVDGFVSLESGRMGGELLTEPLPFAGRRVDLNARTVHDGVIEIEFLDEQRQPIPGVQPFVFRGDATAAALAPPGGDGRLPTTASGTLVLKVFLQNAALYSLRPQK